MCDLTLGKVWLRGALIPSGGYLGQELNRIAVDEPQRDGAAIVLVTTLLIGLLLATRISLAAIFVALITSWSTSAAPSRCSGRASPSAGAKRR